MQNGLGRVACLDNSELAGYWPVVEWGKECVRRAGQYSVTRRMVSSIRRIRPLLTSTDEKKMLANLLALRETFRDNMQETVDALELNQREKAEALLSTTTRKNLQEIRSLIEHLVNEQQEVIAARQREVLENKAETDATLSRSRAIIIGSGLGAAAVVLLLSLLLARKVAAPL